MPRDALAEHGVTIDASAVPSRISFAGDFNGDNTADVGLRDPQSGWFYLRYGPGFTNQTAFQWDHD